MNNFALNNNKKYNGTVKLATVLLRITLFLLFLLSLGTMLYGTPSVRDRDIYKKVGYFEIRPYKYGLYMTVPGSGVFYNISPYDAFVRNSEGYQMNLITWENPIESKEPKEIALTTTKHLQIMNTVTSYFGTNDPKATFESEGYKINYSSEVTGNKLRVYVREHTLNNLTPGSKLVVGVTFNDSDFVFDEKGTEYNQDEQEELNSFRKAYDFDLTAYDLQNKPQWLKIPDSVQYLLITNREHNGVMRIGVKGPNHRIETVDFVNNVVEFTIENVQNPYIELEIFNGVKEATRGI
jgi:hypothetical protein